MAFRLYPFPKSRNPVPIEPLSLEETARRAKHALSGFPEPDLYQNTDLASTLGSVTPSRRGQD